MVSSVSSSIPVFRTHLSSRTSGEPVTGAGDTGREEGGGDTGEEGADEEVAGKRNIGSLTTSEYTRTSLSTVTKLILAWPGLLCRTPDPDQFCHVSCCNLLYTLMCNKVSSYSHSKSFSFPVSHDVVSNTSEAIYLDAGGIIIKLSLAI